MKLKLGNLRLLMINITNAFRRLKWAMTHRAFSDIEKFGFTLALRHIREGRSELAVEDLTWLGSRIA